MSRPGIVRSALVALICCTFIGSANAQTSLDDLLTPYLAKYELPALAAAVVKDGTIIAVGAVGTRKAGEKIPVTRNDRFHLGSDAKAMTALLAAMLVEEGKLKWTTTIPDVFPEFAETMDAGLKAVTLEQFLSHTSGIPSDNEAFNTVMMKSFAEGDKNLDDLRVWLVREWSKQPLQSKPGTKFAYANVNYVIVGAMIERLTGSTWEQVLTERVFKPLELKTTGFGCQATLGTIDAPLGHAHVAGKLKAMLAGPNGDNPLILGPAGTAHMSVLDFARWAGWNAGEGKRGPKFVSTETIKKLHTPVIEMAVKKDAKPGTPSKGGYGLGWGQLDVVWAPNPLGFHGGSNGNNLAHIWLDTKHDFAMVFVTNISNPKAEAGFFALADEVYAKYGAGKR